MVHLQGGQILSLYPRSELAKDAGIPRGPAQSGEFSLSHIVATRDQVEALLAKAEAAGARGRHLWDIQVDERRIRDDRQPHPRYRDGRVGEEHVLAGALGAYWPAGDPSRLSLLEAGLDQAV
jgi:hypothetical protein